MSFSNFNFPRDNSVDSGHIKDGEIVNADINASAAIAWSKMATTGAITATSITLANTGLHLLDTNASHDLIIAPGSDLTADRTLTLTTGDSDRSITLSRNLIAADESNIVYVGKHGNDSNDGLSKDAAKLTIGAAITAASSGDVVVCLDGGTYTENLTMVTGIDVYAPNITLAGVHTLANDSFLEVKSATVATGVIGFTLNTASAESHVRIDDLIITGTGIGFVSLQGKLFIHTNHIDLATGFAVGSTTADEVYLTFEEIKITGAGTAFGTAASGDINVIGSCIEDDGSGTLALGTPGSSAGIHVNCAKIDINVLSNINANVDLDIITSHLAGTNTESGAGKANVISADKITNVPIASINTTATTFVTAAATLNTQINTHTDTAADINCAIIKHTDTAGSSATLVLGKSKGTEASETIVSSGDTLGCIIFSGYDGVDYLTAAEICAGVDTTPGADDMPGSLSFKVTADGAAAPTEALKISNDLDSLFSGNIELASGKNINDANGNELIQFTQTGSAVNQIKITNAAAGNPALLEVDGETNVGLDIKGKGTGEVGIFTNGNEAINVDQNGIVTKPLQPAFSAYNSATDLNVTGDGTAITVDFDTEIFDLNADFASDTFTAPVTGKYQLNAKVQLEGLTVGTHLIALSIATSNRTYYYRVLANNTDETVGFSVLADMDATDTASVGLTVSGGALSVDVFGGGDPWTIFSGYLVC